MKFVVPIPLGWYLIFCLIILAVSIKIFFIAAAIGLAYLLIFKTKVFFQTLLYLFIIGLPGLAIKHWAISIIIGIFCLIGFIVSREDKDKKEITIEKNSDSQERN